MNAGSGIDFKVAIPARYGSTRLPGKPLLPLAGKPLIEHVYRRAQASGAAEVVIATDDQKVYQYATSLGATVCMTAADHPTGTDRLAEVARLRGWPDDAIVVNLQGDEPLMPPALLHQVARGLSEHTDAGIATLCTPIRNVADVFDPHIVKVVPSAAGYAQYFSRAPIPYQRETFPQGAVSTQLNGVPYWRHIGIYAYRAEVLRAYPSLAPAPAEQAEKLEQLRALWHDIKIHVQEALQPPPLGVDTPEDLARVELELEA